MYDVAKERVVCGVAESAACDMASRRGRRATMESGYA
jgi:hypothetical protein